MSDSKENENDKIGVFDDAIASFLAPIKDLLFDPKVSEIMINGPKEIFVEKNWNVN